MEKFVSLTHVAAPLMRRNIDTDAIIPGKELMKVAKSGYGEGLFGQWRYKDDQRTENPDFVLNREPYRSARILLAGENFGCGSSREVAVWALRDFGIRSVIAPSFAYIFFNNCFKNGLLPVILPVRHVEELSKQIEKSQGQGLVTIDLESCTVIAPQGEEFPFEIDRFHREALLQGLDAIDATLHFLGEIDAFQKRDRLKRPWVYEY
jgi:3-isopropylmalate/(R)-2-methylmalate dehydratase small subunit